MTLIIGGLVVLALTWALTGLLRRYAVHKQLMDIPNARSSHKVPTPRGGGVAIVVVGLLALPALVYGTSVSLDSAIAFGGAGLAVAAVGWLDDHGHVAAGWRLLVHFLAAGWGLYWLGGMPDLTLFGWTMPGLWLALPALVWLVWLLNLYNFMDGIDGIAGVEALTACASGLLLAWLMVPEAPLALYGVMILAALGFLVWNFPPAKIFMGDAGSGFVGLWLGLLSIYAAHQAPVLFWGWVILLAMFVSDATVTLFFRWCRRESLFEAHRSHAYQHRAAQWGHKATTLFYGTLNVIWLLPMAWWVVSGGIEPLWGVLLAYAPVVFLVYQFGAGIRHVER
ncbi:MraY family glycosyltransferase [Marinimicrobium locisalis]|uniref:MraY family glycosyltransferase n=1 Tax=Marinimicrobium locisalis TaxID=546022 RepID=UPI0032214CBE